MTRERREYICLGMFVDAHGEEEKFILKFLQNEYRERDEIHMTYVERGEMHADDAQNDLAQRLDKK